MTRLGGVLLTMAAALLTACFEKVSTSSDYRITPYLQRMVDGPAVIDDGVVAYAFYADTTEWTVASYADALAGVLSSKGDGTKRSDPVAVSRPVEGEAITLPVDRSPITVVVCDTLRRLYGWRMAETAENLPVIYVSITFRPWKEEIAYVEGPWRMINEFYEPAPPTVWIYQLTPQLQTDPLALPQVADGVVGYVYYADTTEWTVASYADAFTGILTSKQTGEKTDAYVERGHLQTDGRLTFTLEQSPVTLLACDTVRRLYAWRMAVLPADFEQPAPDKVTFAPWQQARTYLDGAWRIVNEFYRPPATEQTAPR